MLLQIGRANLTFFKMKVKNRPNMLFLQTGLENRSLGRFLRSARILKGNNMNFQFFLRKSRFFSFFVPVWPPKVTTNFATLKYGRFSNSIGFSAGKDTKKPNVKKSFPRPLKKLLLTGFLVWSPIREQSGLKNVYFGLFGGFSP